LPSRRSGIYAEEAYKALACLAEAVKVKEQNPAVLDLDLLLAIAKEQGNLQGKLPSLVLS
jgi:hypothetical protein